MTKHLKMANVESNMWKVKGKFVLNLCHCVDSEGLLFKLLISVKM